MLWLDAGFYQQTVYAQDWVCLANARYPRITSDQPAHWNISAYQQEAHIGINSGTGCQFHDNAVASQNLTRRIQLEMPGFMGLSAILASSYLWHPCRAILVKRWHASA